MKTGKPIAVHDLYEWLPPYGESDVNLHWDGRELVVTIRFDDEASGKVLEKPITFAHTVSFHVAASPGVDILDLHYEDACLVGPLAEYRVSESAQAWSTHLGGTQIRHFQLFLSAENVRLDVFAEDFSVQ